MNASGYARVHIYTNAYVRVCVCVHPFPILIFTISSTVCSATLASHSDRSQFERSTGCRRGQTRHATWDSHHVDQYRRVDSVYISFASGIPPYS